MADHAFEKSLGGFCDQYRCTCGFETNGYWDGPEWAEEELQLHFAHPTLTSREIMIMRRDNSRRNDQTRYNGPPEQRPQAS